jgi:hypothetical protein
VSFTLAYYYYAETKRATEIRSKFHHTINLPTDPNGLDRADGGREGGGVGGQGFGRISRRG